VPHSQACWRSRAEHNDRLEGIDTSRVAFLGWSMGGYGALRLGAILGPTRAAAICAVSAALWTSYSDVEAGAFDSADD
jgi:dipeptidyl aminopeptidase/acylaminoacyl peptidase